MARSATQYLIHSNNKLIINKLNFRMVVTIAYIKLVRLKIKNNNSILKISIVRINSCTNLQLKFNIKIHCNKLTNNNIISINCP
jgi:hypothetical protein